MAKRTFAFELSKPTKRGMLMKQGALHRAFKYRYFVLYPGFLVYYDTETKWKVDLAKGETLGVSFNATVHVLCCRKFVHGRGNMALAACRFDMSTCKRLVFSLLVCTLPVNTQTS